jgi:hypothetical protein
LLAGHVRVDDGAFLGGGSTFHQFMHVGRLVMVQGSSALGKICHRSSSRGAQFRFRTEYHWTAPRWRQRQRPRRNQSGIQTYLSERTKHIAGTQESGSDEPLAHQHANSWISSPVQRSAAFAHSNAGTGDDVSV